jgi:uncharacterized protein YjbI with pentapeptide repeats
LEKAIFYNCDLSGSIFYNTDLRAANFKSSYNFSIDPEENRLTGATFARDNLSGLLEKYRLKIK